MFFEFEFIIDFGIAKGALGLQLMRTLLLMFFFLLDLDNFKTVITVLELLLTLALFDVVLEKFRDLYCLMAEIAVCQIFAFFCQMQIE
jgi:hypothetical protein